MLSDWPGDAGQKRPFTSHHYLSAKSCLVPGTSLKNSSLHNLFWDTITGEELLEHIEHPKLPQLYLGNRICMQKALWWECLRHSVVVSFCFFLGIKGSFTLNFSWNKRQIQMFLKYLANKAIILCKVKS